MSLPQVLSGSRLRAASPIRSASPNFIDALSKLIDSGQLVSGPFLGFDRESQVYLVVVVEQGVVVHWQMECCCDQEEADALTERFKHLFRDALAHLMSHQTH
jgi:hypothetical protein